VIIACYSVFNDMPILKESIESVSPYVDKIIVVDGAYREFPHKDFRSTDGTLEYLKSIEKVELIEAKSAWKDQISKRNATLIGSVGDWYLVIDGDEIWTGDFRLPSADVGIIKCKRTSDGAKYDRARIFKHIEGLHYEGKHYWLVDKNGKTFSLLADSGLRYSAERLFNRPSIIHKDDKRDYERMMAKKKYYMAHSARESKIKEVK